MRGRSIAQWLAATILGAMAACASPAAARGPDNPFLGLGAETQAPRGFAEMCGTMPALCHSFAGSGAGSDGSGAREAPADPLLIVPGGDAGPQLRLVCGVVGFAELSLACRVEGAAQPAPPLAGGAGAMFASLTLDRPHLPTLPQIAPPKLAFAPPQTVLPSPPAPPPAPPPSPPPQEWSRLLRRVNDRVNARVHQQSDLATYGVPELWRPSGDGRRAAGDCEDLALEKRVELIAADFPPERLFLAVVFRSDVGLHTVLVARLDEGDVVLDSRVGFIEHWSRAGYSWLSVEAPGEPMVWRAVA